MSIKKFGNKKNISLIKHNFFYNVVLIKKNEHPFFMF